jgi:ATP-dependent helicase/nuclease subunit B
VTRKHLPTLSETSFLEELALAVLNSKKMGECAVVLPSFRAVTAFKRVFTTKATKACRMPHVMTLGAFMEGNGEFQIADNLEILARLYQVQLNHTKEKKDFSLFLNWGSVALADFHQIDHHMKDANQVFKNLRDIKEIEEWSFDPSKKLTEAQISFMNQWDRLPHLYKDLHERLKKDGMTTKAMLSWDVAKKGNVQKYQAVYAAGLAAITPSEKLYLTKWHEAGKLIYLPDADVSYVHDAQIEAGYFMRELREFPYNIPDQIAPSPPDLEIIGCSSVMSSCQLVRQIVLELSEDEKNKTVIVLPDAGTLPVLLQALPNNEVGYNVTMGLSIRETPISPFLNLIDRMTSRSDSGWRFEELVSLASQQVVLEYTENTTSFKSDSTNSLHELAKRNSGWVSITTIEEVSDGTFYSLLKDLEQLKAPGAKEFLKGLDDFSRKIEMNLEDSKNPWIKAGWTSVRKVVSIMLRLQADLNPCNSASDVRALMHKLLGGEKINLIGEPAR